jgi:hypothetical protein
MTRPTILLLLSVFVGAGTCLPSRCLATKGGYTYRHTEWWEGFTKYAVDMGSDAMIYIPSFIKIGSGIQKLTKGDTQTARWSHKPTFLISKTKGRLMRSPFSVFVCLSPLPQSTFNCLNLKVGIAEPEEACLCVCVCISSYQCRQRLGC